MTILITGVTGQDGSYLAEFLLDKGHQVIGVVRNIQKAKETLSLYLKNSLELVEWDMRDQNRIKNILTEFRPTEVYNFAAYSSGAGMFDDPVRIGDVNGLAVVRIMEAICEVNVKIRFCQASSREVFGEPTESPQTEFTTTNPRSPYGAAKLYADSMIQIYCQRYNLFACSAILFNHESPRRGFESVTRKITYEAVRIKLGLAAELHLGNLDAYRDWGFAGDYVKAMWLMLQQEHPDRYIIASGQVHSVRDWCDLTFRYLGMDYRDYVKEDKLAYRPAELLPLVGSAEKAHCKLGWRPKIEFKELVKMMVDADFQLLTDNIKH